MSKSPRKKKFVLAPRVGRTKLTVDYAGGPNARRLAAVLLACLHVLVVVVRDTEAGEAPGYTVTLDGERCNITAFYGFSLDARPGRGPGDVVYVDGIPIVLGPYGTYRFRTTPKHDGRLLLVGEDGTETVVGVKVDWAWEGEREVFFDPLAKLTPDEIRGLRGIYLDAWTQGAAERLKHVDPARVCITITDESAQGEAKTLPALPPGLWYLNIDGIENYDALARQHELRFLRFEASSAHALDAGLIESNTKLRYLDMCGNDLVRPERLASLAGLRDLRLSWCEDLGDISFVRNMGALRRLDIRRTGVADLSPIGGHPSLEHINANSTPVARLPTDPMPSLRTLWVMSTKLPAEAVAEFAATNPKCRVWYDWNEELRRELAGANSVRVVAGDLAIDVGVSEDATLFTVTDPEEVSSLIENIEVSEWDQRCSCAGGPILYFRTGDGPTASFTVHHGRSLRWWGWPADGILTAESAAYLREWFAQHGVVLPVSHSPSSPSVDLAVIATALAVVAALVVAAALVTRRKEAGRSRRE